MPSTWCLSVRRSSGLRVVWPDAGLRSAAEHVARMTPGFLGAGDEPRVRRVQDLVHVSTRRLLRGCGLGRAHAWSASSVMRRPPNGPSRPPGFLARSRRGRSQTGSPRSGPGSGQEQHWYSSLACCLPESELQRRQDHRRTTRRAQARHQSHAAPTLVPLACTRSVTGAAPPPGDMLLICGRETFGLYPVWAPLKPARITAHYRPGSDSD